MLRTIVLLALWAGCFAECVSAQSASITRDPDLYSLARVHLFAIETIGFAGQIQPGEQRLERILERPTAVRDLRRLIGSARRKHRVTRLSASINSIAAGSSNSRNACRTRAQRF
jgi:hypothetical protein